MLHLSGMKPDKMALEGREHPRAETCSFEDIQILLNVQMSHQESFDTHAYISRDFVEGF